jgi:ketopantoate reductase
MNLKKNGKIFTSKFVGTGPSSYEKRIYRAAVSQSHHCHTVKDTSREALGSTELCDSPYYGIVWQPLLRNCVTAPTTELCDSPYYGIVWQSLLRNCVTVPTTELCDSPYYGIVWQSLLRNCVTVPTTELCDSPY